MKKRVQKKSSRTSDKNKHKFFIITSIAIIFILAIIIFNVRKTGLGGGTEYNYEYDDYTATNDASSSTSPSYGDETCGADSATVQTDEGVVCAPSPSGDDPTKFDCDKDKDGIKECQKDDICATCKGIPVCVDNDGSDKGCNQLVSSCGWINQPPKIDNSDGMPCCASDQKICPAGKDPIKYGCCPSTSTCKDYHDNPKCDYSNQDPKGSNCQQGLEKCGDFSCCDTAKEVCMKGVCQPKDHVAEKCSAGSTKCGDNSGKNILCCKDLSEDCQVVEVNIPLFGGIYGQCVPKEATCASMGKIRCAGAGIWGKGGKYGERAFCCDPGKCQVSPDGWPKCLP